MKMLFACFAWGLAALLFTFATSAAPIAYNEGVDGDLSSPATGGALTEFTFDVGANTVSGTVTYTSIAGPDFDSFAFIVPAGKEVTLATFTAADVTGDINHAGWVLYHGSDLAANGTVREGFDVNPPVVQTFTTTPFEPDPYNIIQNDLGRLTAVDSSASYTFSFTVANIIPEPAALSIFTFIAFGLFRRPRPEV